MKIAKSNYTLDLKNILIISIILFRAFTNNTCRQQIIFTNYFYFTMIFRSS